MIRTFHAISTLLLMTAIGFILYNLIWQFAVNGQVKVLSIREIWTDFDKHSFENSKVFIQSYIPASDWTMVTEAPAAMVFLVIAGIFYLPARLLMLFGIGKKQKEWR